MTSERDFHDAKAMLDAARIPYTPVDLNNVIQYLARLIEKRAGEAQGPFFRIPHGTIVRCEYAGVVLMFRAYGDGTSALSVWRLPDARFNSEDFCFDGTGAERSHGVCVRDCPPPGPRPLPDTGPEEHE